MPIDLFDGKLYVNSTISNSMEEKASLCSEDKEDLDEKDEMEHIRVKGKGKTKGEFHFQEAHYQDSLAYEDSDLETHQEN